ncbi:ATP-dependent DNA ligase [Paenarthrobacter sp. DKR-5]|uniref:ATP-dependent DNA ligase n=1 Tax=Paenarthrobacter sp. DKR-5 TaxID=2835535 RepID=UPI001BDCE02C|nr:ATP-dependent DNA ligase [Paenarthrobacter sp. DKR-5]MBT1001805.1 ATP-dependent DNA ligase [Paenarthrobacter sp. DKR-5]
MATTSGTGSNRQIVDIEGRRLRLTNLDKVLYPATGTTKADVLSYLAAVAPLLIAHARDRPVTRKRWVHGVGTADQPGAMFFQKNLDKSAPEWVPRVTLQHKEHVNTYPLLNDLATLTWLGQIGALEIHVPQWTVDEAGQPRNPDRMVLDLDPGDGAGLAECAEVARLARAILGGMGLEPVPVTSGSKGIHLYAALDGGETSDQVSAVAHELARALEADHPDLVVSDMKKSLRAGKVLVDWSQNSAAKTTIAPYSLRGRVRPMVACPRTWAELDDPDLSHLDYLHVLERIKHVQDPMASLSPGHPGAVAEPDRLHRYRTMRDAERTPEPVPDTAPSAAGGNSFVIQEHHARRLHWDFRLEHDGVLVSWAVPKGPPDSPKQNHLAVQTEDHPLEYGTFEGRIPKGEYGAGDVAIWDAGTYELEKWRDGKEVIATLTGRADGGLGGGPRRFALIRTGGGGEQKNNWLIHLMKDQHPDAAAEPTAADGAAGQPSRADHGVLPSHAPMLATASNLQELEGEALSDEDWLYEMKWDGIRAVAAVQDGGVRLLSRNGNDLTAGYPELQELAGAVREPVLLDMEIVALDRKGRPDFGLLQQRMNLVKPAEIEAATRQVPVHAFAFDILNRGGRSLLKMPLRERRKELEDVLRPAAADRVQLSPLFEGPPSHVLAISEEHGLEGLLAKKAGSSYLPGRRSRSWLKVKHARTQEVVIAGWRPGGGRRAGTVGSLLLGVPADGDLRYVGRVGTGFRERDLEDLSRLLARLERKTSPLRDVPAADARDAHWVTPRLVGEVTFAERTATGRLRHPSWRGLRPDKEPADVVPE